MPNIKSATTLILENLLPVIKSRVNLQVIWFVYSPDKLNLEKTNDPTEKIIDIHDYKNVIEVIKKEKPDMIYSAASWDPISYSFSLAGKLFNIPVFDFTVGTFTERSQSDLVKSYVTRFFENSTPTDTSPKKQFMRRGRFFIYKYLFLLKTQQALKVGTRKIINDFFLLLKLYLSNYKPIFDSKFANTVHFLDNEKTAKIFLDGGFEPSSLVVTGNPMYDKLYDRVSKVSPSSNDGKIRVLFAPSTLYEHGYWTRQQRDFAVTEIVKKIVENKDEISLTVKIHPSTSILSQYQELVHSIDPSIPVHQTGDIQEFLFASDVLVSFQSSTVEQYALLVKKPLVLCNFFKSIDDEFVNLGLAEKCTEPDSLIKTIRQVISSNPATEQKREDYIKEFLYKFDGQCAKRICDKIMTLLEGNNNSNQNK